MHPESRAERLPFLETEIVQSSILRLATAIATHMSTGEFYIDYPLGHKPTVARTYFSASYIPRASCSFFITPCFSSAEFQSGYASVISIVRSIHALK